MQISQSSSNPIQNRLFSYSSSLNNNPDAFDNALSSLISSITFGDASSAKTYLTRVEELIPPSYAESNGQLIDFLNRVSSALSNDNILDAQNALASWRSNAKQPDSGKSAVSSSSSASTGSGDSAFSDVAHNVLNLFSAINSGDVSGAQSAYDSLASQIDAIDSPSSLGFSSNYESLGNDYSSKDILPQIGSALDSNDVTSAQTAFGSFLQTLSTGSLVSTTA